MAALVSAPLTTKEELVGLTVLLPLIPQLHHDLVGSQWLQYDQEYRECAAVSGIKKYGELNLTMYGRCLPFKLPVAPAINTIKQTYPEGTKGKGLAKELCCNKRFTAIKPLVTLTTAVSIVVIDAKQQSVLW